MARLEVPDGFAPLEHTAPAVVKPTPDSVLPPKFNGYRELEEAPEETGEFERDPNTGCLVSLYTNGVTPADCAAYEQQQRESLLRRLQQ